MLIPFDRFDAEYKKCHESDEAQYKKLIDKLAIRNNMALEYPSDLFHTAAALAVAEGVYTYAQSLTADRGDGLFDEEDIFKWVAERVTGWVLGTMRNGRPSDYDVALAAQWARAGGNYSNCNAAMRAMKTIRWEVECEAREERYRKAFWCVRKGDKMWRKKVDGTTIKYTRDKAHAAVWTYDTRPPLVMGGEVYEIYSENV